jgi:hypothetical protein
MTEIKLAASLAALLLVIGFAAYAPGLLGPALAACCAWVTFCLYWERLL